MCWGVRRWSFLQVSLTPDVCNGHKRVRKRRADVGTMRLIAAEVIPIASAKCSAECRPPTAPVRDDPLLIDDDWDMRRDSAANPPGLLRAGDGVGADQSPFCLRPRDQIRLKVSPPSSSKRLA